MTAAVTGLLLAAGAGRRAGGPKALRHDPDGTSWLLRTVRLLRDGGCADVTVVLGCGAEPARALLAAAPWPTAGPPATVEAADWADGMGASLRAGLRSVPTGRTSGVLVHLVDLPDVGAAVVARVLAAGGDPGSLARATYAGVPGHPVLLGAAHVEAVAAGLGGDTGARDYLERHGARGVECGDLASGRDRDEG